MYVNKQNIPLSFTFLENDCIKWRHSYYLHFNVTYIVCYIYFFLKMFTWLTFYQNILFKSIDYMWYTPLFTGNIVFFFTLLVMNSVTKRLSFVSTQIPHGFCNPQLSMQRRNIPAWSGKKKTIWNNDENSAFTILLYTGKYMSPFFRPFRPPC